MNEEKVACRYCNGTGEIKTTIKSNGEKRIHTQDCPICGGDGELNQKETIRLEYEED